MADFNFLFSSVTFLQLYLPLVIKAQEKGLTCRFFIRSNAKAYANPLTRKKKWENLLKQYSIPLLEMKELNDYPGIIICVDGDIYGPAKKLAHTSILPKLDRSKFLIISLTENFNFKESYYAYTKWIDYIIIQNKIHQKYYKFNPKQSLILGVPKYDITFDSAEIFKKHNLDPNAKYVTIFYPRFDRGQEKFGPDFDKLYAQLYIWLRNLDFKILVKNREKLGLGNQIYKGNHYFEDFYYYPNISMELLHISKLAIFFGSAVIEEVVMSKTPFVEFSFDNVDRFSFLRNPNYGYLIEDKWPSVDEFNENVQKIMQASPSEFDQTIEKYLFTGQCCATRMIDKMIKLYKIKNNQDNNKN